MSKHNAMILCEHKKVTCPSCNEVIKAIKSIVNDIDTKSGRLVKIARLVGVRIDE